MPNLGPRKHISTRSTQHRSTSPVSNEPLSIQPVNTPPPATAIEQVKKKTLRKRVSFGLV
ncbi:hypothetical protein DCAR_0312264 [Daucus carota subsp. sativus]|uniref:Uncharacterized protein n=1 Tax=Daucus carota subsp. sativus TaxID=79200 RepID=A0A166AWV7_DAUCS|nr:hypothetical protein DCAR_0312264 [Daucus carota subsp. sativus]